MYIYIYIYNLIALGKCKVTKSPNRNIELEVGGEGIHILWLFYCLSNIYGKGCSFYIFVINDSKPSTTFSK